MEAASWSVYIHTVPNGKVYVGATSKPPKKRWQYGHGYRGNVRFFDDIVRFGWNNIKHDVICSGLTEAQAYEMEMDLIHKHDALNPQNGYNRTRGGKGLLGYKPTAETIERLSRSHVGLKLPHTAEWNRNISKALSGKKKPHKGVPRSASCRAKIAKIHAKAVQQYSKTGEFIAEYASAREAQKVTGIKNQGISLCCAGRQGTAGGYIWKFK